MAGRSVWSLHHDPSPPRPIFLWVLQRGMEDKWIAISSVLITCRELLCSSIKQFFPPLVKCNLVTQWTKKKKTWKGPRSVLISAASSRRRVDRLEHWMHLPLVSSTDAHCRDTPLSKRSTKTPQIELTQIIMSRWINCKDRWKTNDYHCQKCKDAQTQHYKRFLVGIIYNYLFFSARMNVKVATHLNPNTTND